jgi:predicted ATPase
VDIPLPAGRAPSLPPEELRRRQLAAIVALVLAGARSQPAAIAVEDLHWADPTSLDLLQTLAERGRQAPLFLIATARPEFRPPWSLRSHHSVVSLSPLDRTEVERMVEDIAQRHALSKDVIDGVSERTGGVPLFVEEVTRLLLERGEDGGAHAIPPTLQQSLAARLDRLGEAREIAQIGAVLGRDFSHALLGAVAGIDDAALRSGLKRLADADILFVEGAPPQATYRFKHALIQDAAMLASCEHRSDCSWRCGTQFTERPTSSLSRRTQRRSQAPIFSPFDTHPGDGVRTPKEHLRCPLRYLVNSQLATFDGPSARWRFHLA